MSRLPGREPARQRLLPRCGDNLMERVEIVVEQMGARAIQSLIHEVRASAATLPGDDEMRARERLLAERELAEIGSNRGVRLG